MLALVLALAALAWAALASAAYGACPTRDGSPSEAPSTPAPQAQEQPGGDAEGTPDVACTEPDATSTWNSGTPEGAGNSGTPEGTGDADTPEGAADVSKPGPDRGWPDADEEESQAEPEGESDGSEEERSDPRGDHEDEDERPDGGAERGGDADTERRDAEGGGPSYTIPGPIQVAVPNYLLDRFRIPPFLLPIYQAAGAEYGVPWQVLAAINELETNYGRNLGVSSAGAMGWMQFLPSSWAVYGVDANGDGRRDPYNPADAIFAAARYLKAAGGGQDLSRAIFAYNHADWYVAAVMARTRAIQGLPPDVVGALTGLAEGRFPVAAPATYAGGADAGIDLRSRPGAPVIAVNDGVITRVGHDAQRGAVVELRDVYGNRYTYSGLGMLVDSYPAPRPGTSAGSRRDLDLPDAGPPPRGPASAGRLPSAGSHSPRAGGESWSGGSRSAVPSYSSSAAYTRQLLGLDSGEVVMRPLRPGASVVAGTVLGRVARAGAGRPALGFAVRPAGDGAPSIDPRPILDGWKMLESTGIHRRPGTGRFVRGRTADTRVLTQGKEALARRVLADRRNRIYDCGRSDVQAGRIDRRVLAVLAYLSAGGLEPSVTSLKCGHAFHTKGGGISAHSSGNAVDIAAVNGIPILGNQGPGSITERTIRRLLTLRGSMRPAQIISLMTFEGAGNTLSMGDHADHIHVGFQPGSGSQVGIGEDYNVVLEPDQWARLTQRVQEINDPSRVDQKEPKGDREPPQGGKDDPQGGGDDPPAESQDEDSQDQPEGQIQPESDRDGDPDHSSGDPGISSTSEPSSTADDSEDSGEPTIRVLGDRTLEVGASLGLKGTGWTCQDGTIPDGVTVTLLDADGNVLGELADPAPDGDGGFEVSVRLRSGLLPDDLDKRTRLEVHAEARCGSGELLSTDKNAVIEVVRRPSSGDGDSEGGHGAGNKRSDDETNEDDKRGGSDEEGEEEEDSDETDEEDSGDSDDDRQGDEDENVDGDDDEDEDDGDDDDDDSGGKNKNKKDKGGGGDGDGDRDGDKDDDDDSGGGGGGKSVKRIVPPAATKPIPLGLPAFEFPRSASFWLIAAICTGLALLLALLTLPANRWLGPSIAHAQLRLDEAQERFNRSQRERAAAPPLPGPS